MSVNLMAKVAGDLRAIVELHERLLTQAVHSANDPLMPGGLAMVELAHVASPTEWQWNLDEIERFAAESDELCVRDAQPDISHEDDSWEPPLQTLLFWSEQWRLDRGYPLENRQPNVGTEAAFLRHSVDWAWDNEPHFDNFVTDVATARRRIEDTLHEGERSLRGAPCMYETCGGTRVVRKIQPKRDKDGNKIWEWSDWHCPKCHRSWDEDQYARNVTAAHERTKFEEINGETWCSYDYAARRVGRPEGTIRAWVARTKNPTTDNDRLYPIATACLIRGRRTKFVRLADVENRHRRTGRRGRAA